MGYNKLCFGNFLSFGYINENFNSSLAQGFMGFNWPKLSAIYYMTMHPAMGLFWQSPALLLSVFGAIFMFRNRRYRVEAILAMAVIGFYIVIISGFYSWWGGWDLGPRYLIPILPFFSIFLAFVPKQLTWPLVTLSLVSFAQMLIGAAGVLQVPDVMVSKFGKLGFFEYSYIYSYCLKQLVKGNLARNLGHQLLGLRSWNSLIPLVVVIGSVSFFFLKRMGIFHHQNHPLLPS
jgi:hypothetical protein